MKVIVFGASGYIGRHAVRRLVECGHGVIGHARSPESARTIEQLGAKTFVCGIDDETVIGEQLTDCDALVWIAQLMLEDERRMLSFLIDRLAGTGKTLIFTGGTSLLSQKTNGLWSEESFAEDEPFQPRKQIAPRLEIENMVRAASSSGIRTMVIRPALVWGHGQSQVIAEYYHSARRTGAVCYIGRGLNVYSNIHVDEVAEIYRLMLERGVAGALYHGVSGEVSYGVIADRVARHLGVPTRSVTIEEGCEIWDKFMASIVLCSCSRVRAPRTRRDLQWIPHPDRLDLLEDCVHPAYAAMDERATPSWVRKP